MAKRKKDELIRIILNQGNIDANENYDELIELLFDEPISINVNKEEKKTFGESVADKITAIAGSWTFILLFCGFLLLITSFKNSTCSSVIHTYSGFNLDKSMVSM